MVLNKLCHLGDVEDEDTVRVQFIPIVNRARAEAFIEFEFPIHLRIPPPCSPVSRQHP